MPHDPCLSGLLGLCELGGWFPLTLPSFTEATGTYIWARLEGLANLMTNPHRGEVARTRLLLQTAEKAEESDYQPYRLPR